MEAKHLEECTRKTEPCEHCRKEVSLREMKRHLKLCPSMMISCPNQCGLQQKTRAEVCITAFNSSHSVQIQEHMPDCPRKGVVCPFAEFGCNYSGGREHLQKHIKEQIVQHLSFVCIGLLEFRDLVTHAYLNLEKMTRNSDVLQGRVSFIDYCCCCCRCREKP